LNLQTFEALFYRADGQIFVSGSEGFLYSFEISTKTEQFLGDLGNSSVEDLVEYTGNLYASTAQRKLVHINLTAPSQSEEVMDLASIPSLKGLYTSENLDAPCEVLSMFGISDLGKAYKIGPEFNQIEEICDLGFSVSGATSSLDLIQFTPLTIQNIIISPSQCSTDNGRAAIEVSGGIGSHLFAINDAAYVMDSLLLNIGPGNYTIHVRDENNCVVSQAITIENTAYPVINEIMSESPICLNGKGSVSVIAQGSTKLEYSLDGTNYQVSADFTQVAGGTYDIWVRDSNGCQDMEQLDLLPNDKFEIEEIRITAASCDSENGSVEVSLSANYNDLSFQLDDRVQMTTVFDNIPAGIHNLTVSQGMDCRIDTVVQVRSERCGIFVPSAFSPDHDGINDDFRIYTNAQNEVTVNSYQIFDRWGGKIYEATNFSIHEENHWWDGHFNESNLTQGLYVYVIEIAHQDGAIEHLQGQVSIF
jgi:gliding motility-associated-like protein